MKIIYINHLVNVMQNVMRHQEKTTKQKKRLQIVEYTDINYKVYLGSITLMVCKLLEGISRLIDTVSENKRFLSLKKPGCLGSRSNMSLLNIKTTTDMFGLSLGSCCTHNRPMCITLNTSEISVHDSLTASSISSYALSSKNCLQA